MKSWDGTVKPWDRTEKPGDGTRMSWVGSKCPDVREKRVLRQCEVAQH